MTTALLLLVLTLLCVCAVSALLAADLMAAVILFGVFSFLSAGLYAVVGALDVSFTEAVLGAVITTVFFVAAIHESTARANVSHRKQKVRWLSLSAALAAGLALGWALQGLPDVGDRASPASRHVSPRYIEKAHEETGARNMVTSVIVDYRGYDTLGETTVIFTAGLSCLLILLPALWLPGRKDPS